MAKLGASSFLGWWSGNVNMPIKVAPKMWYAPGEIIDFDKAADVDYYSIGTDS